MKIPQEQIHSQFLQKKKNFNNESEEKQKRELLSNSGRWSKEEQKIFAKSILEYGNDFQKIQENIKTRTGTQIRSHAQKFLIKLRENSLVIKKGLNKKLCWNKTMNYLRTVFSKEELGKILFSIEDDNKQIKFSNRKKNYKTNKNKKVNNYNKEILKMMNIYVKIMKII